MGDAALLGRDALGPIDPLSALHPPNLLVAAITVIGLMPVLRGPRRRSSA